MIQLKNDNSEMRPQNFVNLSSIIILLALRIDFG